MKIDRRNVFGLAGGVAGLIVTSSAGDAIAATNEDVEFLHGVASGDPLQDRVILWTRITPKSPKVDDINVEWEIASDIGFKKIIGGGIFKTNSGRDYTVKIDADGLKPLHDYYYRFRVGKIYSPIGRTKTLPQGAVDDVVIVAASCALYSCGYYNAYKEIAALPRVDMVLHLGDYIYEYGSNPDQLGMSIGEKINRYPMPAHEAVSLEDYRERFACYRSDPDLQAAHARAPWICVWDDHEVTNDDWTGGAQNHQANEGDWKLRAKASVLAYYEWIPIREPEKGKRPEAINRTFELGNLGTLIMMENRLVGRSRQIDLRNPDDVKWNVVDTSDAANPVIISDAAKIKEIKTFAAQGKEIPAPFAIQLDADSLRKSLANPDRTVFGFDQEKWLQDNLERSVKEKKPWQIIGNQVVMAHSVGLDIPEYLGQDKWQKTLETMSPKLRPWVKQLAGLPKDLPFEFDGWDGYPTARARMDKMFKETKARPIVLSGDSHCFWVNELNDDSGEMVAAEIGTTSITSSSLGNMLGNVELGPAYVKASKEVLFCDHLTRGFAILTINKNEARADLIGISNVFSKEYKVFPLKSYLIKPAKDEGLERLQQI
jgi:alkaline phosphatase D